MAIVSLRNHTQGRACHRRRLAAGKTTTTQAMRCLKRRPSDVACRQMRADAKRLATGPGGHTGAALQSSAADPIPTASTSDQSLPGPATNQPNGDRAVLVGWLGRGWSAEPLAGEHRARLGCGALVLDRAPAGGEALVTAGGMSCLEH